MPDFKAKRRRGNNQKDKSPRKDSKRSGNDKGRDAESAHSASGGKMSDEMFQRYASLLGDHRMSHPANARQRADIVRQIGAHIHRHAARKGLSRGAEEGVRVLPVRMAGTQLQEHRSSLQPFPDRRGMKPQERPAGVPAGVAPGPHAIEGRFPAGVSLLEFGRKGPYGGDEPPGQEKPGAVQRRGPCHRRGMMPGPAAVINLGPPLLGLCFTT